MDLLFTDHPTHLVKEVAEVVGSLVVGTFTLKQEG